MINAEHAKYYTDIPFPYGSSMIHTVQFNKYISTYRLCFNLHFCLLRAQKIVEKSFVIRAVGNRTDLNDLIFCLIWISLSLYLELQLTVIQALSMDLILYRRII